MNVNVQGPLKLYALVSFQQGNVRCGTYIIYSCYFHAEIFTETINLSWRILKKIDTKVQILIY